MFQTHTHKNGLLAIMYSFFSSFWFSGRYKKKHMFLTQKCKNFGSSNNKKKKKKSKKKKKKWSEFDEKFYYYEKKGFSALNNGGGGAPPYFGLGGGAPPPAPPVPTPMGGAVPQVAFCAILGILRNVSLCFQAVHPCLATKSSFVLVISFDKFRDVYWMCIM